MKKKARIMMVSLTIMVMAISFGVYAGTVGGARDYGAFTITCYCTFTASNGEAKATTNGAPSPYLNHVVVYARNADGKALDSGYDTDTCNTADSAESGSSSAG